eukprot:COSAG03_NODE_91_length_13404_cov_69.155205_4_plen_189_part_00
MLSYGRGVGAGTGCPWAEAEAPAPQAVNSASAAANLLVVPIPPRGSVTDSRTDRPSCTSPCALSQRRTECDAAKLLAPPVHARSRGYSLRVGFCKMQSFLADFFARSGSRVRTLVFAVIHFSFVPHSELQESRKALCPLVVALEAAGVTESQPGCAEKQHEATCLVARRPPVRQGLGRAVPYIPPFMF